MDNILYILLLVNLNPKPLLQSAMVSDSVSKSRLLAVLSG